MYIHVDHRWFKTILKKLFSVFLIYSIFFTSSVYAGAAEKWEYEPVMKNMNIEVKAHKVDQYGSAVNDYEYNTKIDPKTAANRTKAGNVGFGRLLKTTGWGLLGSAALEALLEAVDWVIDPETQSIWRNKSNPSYSCKNFGYKWKTNKGYVGVCPSEVAAQAIQYRCEGLISNCRLEGLYTDSSYTDKVEYLPNDSQITTIYARYKFDYDGQAQPGLLGEVIYRDVKDTISTQKETLTPEQLADYANHTHKDYSDPELAPKLEPNYSPKIAEDLWKPSNDWEKENSPTVKEVEQKLDQAPPEPKKDPEITPNPETGGMTLPSFCSWAAPVCEFIKDAKEFVKDDVPDDSDNDPPEIKDIPIGSLDTSAFKGTAGCPSPIQVPVTFAKSGNVEISYEPICAMASKWSFIAPFIGFFSGALIILGVGRKGEDSDT